jgi:hypothetical protein
MLYTDHMKDGCGCMERPQVQEEPGDETVDVVVRGKRERQAVLQRVRRQRALLAKRLRAKISALPEFP